ncbi:YkvA family protein [Pontibacter sp. BT731]|uniref:YkvA family protein n=1 Tax=Pontibacter coccineus TaxID=3063328 RepID=UPI0026E4424C|nr:YkvA family protein [Pontibacter sp. BT731]MDO6389643.1 YkvA family protein [Pontibacter sp. BT731]
MLQQWKATVRKLKEDIYTLYLAYRDPRVPFFAKVVLILTVAYAFSPIDLIPDFIPVLGYLDDLILLPLGIWLSLKLLPAEVVQEYRAKARQQLLERKPNYIMAAVIVLAWLLLGLWLYLRFVVHVD